MRIIANFHKNEDLRFISHLDIQRLVQRAMRRADLPLSYSQGFNPHPILSFASALSVGYTSEAEWMDVRLSENIEPDEFTKKLNTALPEGLRIVRTQVVEETLPSLTALIQRARYQATVYFDQPVSSQALKSALETLLNGPIVVEKHTKGGMKQVDIRPQLISIRFLADDTKSMITSACFDIEGVLNASGSLQIDLLLQALMLACGAKGHTRVHRAAVDFDKIEV